MIPMTKNGSTVYVPDVFVESYRRDGYTVFGEKAVDTAPELPAEEKADEADDDTIDEAEEPAVDTAPELPAEEKADEADGKEEEEPAQNPGKFSCPVCGKEYTKKAYLDRHIKEKHP